MLSTKSETMLVIKYTHTHAILRPSFQVHLCELVLSQRRDLLEHPSDFFEPDVLPATQPVMSKHYRKPSGLVIFCFTDMVTELHSNQKCQSTEGNNHCIVQVSISRKNKIATSGTSITCIQKEYNLILGSKQSTKMVEQIPHK